MSGCKVCEAAHALCLSGAPASAADFLRAAVVQERKAKEAAEAERDAERERCARIVEAYTNTEPDRAIAAAAAQIRSGK